MRQSVLPSRPPQGVGDPAVLVDPAAVSAALARDARARPAAPLRLEKAWPLPRIPLMLLYREEGAAAPGGAPAWWSIHALPQGRLPGAYRRAVERGTAAVVEELGALAQRFPHDLMLPGLPALLDRPAGALDGLPRRSTASVAGPIEAHVVGYKPARRCSLRFAGAGAGELFGKLLAAPVARQQVRVHAAIDRALAVSGRFGVEAAGPEHRLDDLGLLLWRRRRGVSVHEALTGRGPAAAVAGAGRGLAALHASSPAWPDTHPPERELATLGLWVGAAALAFPRRRAALLSAEHRVREAARTAPRGPLRPAHRDFYDKQVLLDGDTVVLLDFETACRAEPELDLANFLAHLELRRLQGAAAAPRELSEEFLAAYGGTASRPDRSRLHWYQAGALLRLACVYAFRPSWGALSDALLAATGRALPTTETTRWEGVWR